MKTREQLRRTVGRNLNALFLGATVHNATTLHVSPSAIGGQQVGLHVWYKGQYAITTRASVTGNQGEFTLDRDLDPFTQGDRVELWTSDYSPELVNDMLDQALSDAVRRVYERADPIYHCVTARNRRLTLPDTVSALAGVYFRYSVGYRNIYLVQDWESRTNESTFSVRSDYRDFQISPATRLTTGNPHRVSTEVADLDLAATTHIEGWFKSSVDMKGANALEIEFYEGTAERGSVSVDLEAGEWTYIMAPISEAWNLDNIDEVRLFHSQAGVLWLNGLWSVNHDTLDWQPRDFMRWMVENETRELKIDPWWDYGALRSYSSQYTVSSGWPLSPENVVRIVTLKDPAAFDDDDDTTEVGDYFLTSRATEFCFSATSGGRTTDPNQSRQQAALWKGRADSELRAQPFIENIRRLD